MTDQTKFSKIRFVETANTDGFKAWDVDIQKGKTETPISSHVSFLAQYRKISVPHDHFS